MGRKNETIGLGIKERFALLAVLPGQGNIMTLRVVRELREELAPSGKEIKAFGIREEKEGNQKSIRWNPEKAKNKEIAIDDARRSIVTEALRKANKAEILTEDLIPLYERFVEKNYEEE